MIEVVDLNKKFGDLHVLKNINMSVSRGEKVVVVGPSGSGKSTFLRCLNCMEDPTSGNIIFNGVDIADMSVDINVHRQKMGMVFQHFNLFNNKTVIENIMLAPVYVETKRMRALKWKKRFGKPVDEPLRTKAEIKAAARETAMQLLRRIGLEEKADVYPSQLSGGQKQRVAIARALATNPQVLLCDEATSALDPATTDSILTLIRDINRDLGITAVIITHEMSVIEKICSHVAIINRGKIVEHGEVEDVFFHPRTEAARRLVMPEALQNLPQENLYRLIFNGRSSFEPVIANMVLECHCPVNIMYADTRDIGGIAFGQMVLQLPECPESRRSILEFAKSRNILLEEMKHV